MHTKTVVGVFANRFDATATLRDLRDAGFSESQIGVISKEPYDPTRVDHTGLADDPTGTRWEEGSGIGAATGAATGLGLGVAVAAGLIPAVGPVIVGGTLVALLASAGAGAVTGTIVGALIGLGIPEGEALSYETEVNEGRTLVTIAAAERYPEALEIIRNHNGLVRANVPGMA